MGDDIGYEIPTCNGGQSYTTPNLDKMARNGLSFTQCHSLPLCAPSRISLLTGKFSFRNYTTWGYLSTDQRTIANMLCDAGYATCYTGKWQLDGGNSSIKTFGWQKYSVFLPFKLESEDDEGSRYKSAKIYQDGGYLPDSASKNKYSDDIFTSYLLKFIDSVHKLNKPFFVYDAMILCHGPFCPTPDDPQYTTWDYAHLRSDPSFFPSMVKYMDKKIGEILTHLQKNNLLDNTMIIYIGDNGTPTYITSQWQGMSVTGGKGATNELGMNVPFYAVWVNKIARNKKCSSLISFVDFLPTLANIAGVSEPTTYGTLDGVNFYSTLFGGPLSGSRTNMFSSYCVAPDSNPWRRWVQNDLYKLYDTNINRKSFTFVKVTECEPDSPPLQNSSLTPQEKAIRDSFKAVLRYYHP